MDKLWITCGQLRFYDNLWITPVLSTGYPQEHWSYPQPYKQANLTLWQVKSDLSTLSTAPTTTATKSIKLRKALRPYLETMDRLRSNKEDQNIETEHRRF